MEYLYFKQRQTITNYGLYSYIVRCGVASIRLPLLKSEAEKNHWFIVSINTNLLYSCSCRALYHYIDCSSKRLDRDDGVVEAHDCSGFFLIYQL